MKIKKIVAPTMKDALRQVKIELGDDAVILQSRKIKSGGLFSFLSREQIEVTAAVDHSAPGITPDNASDSNVSASHAPGTGIREKSLLYNIKDDVERIEDTLAQIGEKLKYDSMPGLPAELNRHFVSLLENGVEKKIASDLMQTVYVETGANGYDNAALVAKLVQQKLRAMFTVTGPLKYSGARPIVMALIGPTGVGKTTTIAKIASQNKFFMKRKVSLVSADTYRMAAIEQLRTFARIASIPLDVVYKPDDLPAALKKNADKDLIVIDTAGRSHRDQDKMRELSDFMEAANPSQIHLTLSAGSKLKDLLDIVDRFHVVPSDSFVITKLDETTDYGNILNLAQRRPKPISYLTLGQNVPDDIAVADNATLAKLVMCKDLDEAAITKGINA